MNDFNLKSQLEYEFFSRENDVAKKSSAMMGAKTGPDSWLAILRSRMTNAYLDTTMFSFYFSFLQFSYFLRIFYGTFFH